MFPIKTRLALRLVIMSYSFVIRRDRISLIDFLISIKLSFFLPPGNYYRNFLYINTEHNEC